VQLPVGVGRLRAGAGLAGGGAILGVVGGVLGRQLLRHAPLRTGPGLTLEAAFFYLGFLEAATFSATTSFQFFTTVLDLPVDLTLFLFTLVEVLLVAAGLAMRRAARNPGESMAAARRLMWLLTGFSAVFAVALGGGPSHVIPRFVAPVAAVIALHYALGVELREARKQQQATVPVGALARVWSHYRETVLAWLGVRAEQDSEQLRKARALREVVRRLRAARALPAGASAKARQRAMDAYWAAVERSDMLYDLDQEALMDQYRAAAAKAQQMWDEEVSQAAAPVAPLPTPVVARPADQQRQRKWWRSTAS
jgi:hypothetical protein